MAIERTLADVDQEKYDDSEAIIISTTVSEKPQLDARRGTALRDLLIGPAAQFHALNSLLNDDLRKTNSLKLVAENPELADEDVVDGILSNVGVTRKPGSAATGSVIFTVSDFKDYSVPQNYLVEDSAGNQFVTESGFSVLSADTPATATEVELREFDSEEQAGQYFFVLPFVAAAVGAQANIEENTALTPRQLIVGVTQVTSYGSFSGGKGQETIEEVLARLPDSLSYTAIESANSISARLFADYSNVFAVSSVGFGNPSQLRDKHNALGVAVGSRVDVYVRTSYDPNIVILQKTATKVSDEVYQFTLNVEDAPGIYHVRGVSAVDSDGANTESGELPVVGSFPFTEEPEAVNITDTFHDFDANNSVVETAYSVFQRRIVTITDVPPVTVSGTPTYPDTITVKVEIYSPKSLDLLQAFFDDDTVRNIEADHVVRGAIPFFVTITADVFRLVDADIDFEEMKDRLVEFVNSKNFNDVLTVSQVSAVLHEFEIIRVGALSLEGEIRAADGTTRSLNGDVLDVGLISDPQVLLAPDTSVFMLDRRDIFLTDREV